MFHYKAQRWFKIPGNKPQGVFALRGSIFELAEIDPIAGRNFTFLSFALSKLSEVPYVITL
jgi:hypothetical protein